MGLRAQLPLTSTPQPRPATLARQLQPATATQLNRRPAPDQPRSQRPWVGQLATCRGKLLSERTAASLGARPFVSISGALVRSGFSVSAVRDGERVGVVGEDRRPAGRDLPALVAFEPAAVEAVAAFEADAALAAGPVAAKAPLGSSGAGLLAARDELPLVGQERVLCWVAPGAGRGEDQPARSTPGVSVTSASWVT
jgi:hypothetical protein